MLPRGSPRSETSFVFVWATQLCQLSILKTETISCFLKIQICELPVKLCGLAFQQQLSGLHVQAPRTVEAPTPEPAPMGVSSDEAASLEAPIR